MLDFENNKIKNYGEIKKSVVIGYDKLIGFHNIETVEFSGGQKVKQILHNHGRLPNGTIVELQIVDRFSVKLIGFEIPKIKKSNLKIIKKTVTTNIFVNIKTIFDLKKIVDVIYNREEIKTKYNEDIEDTKITWRDVEGNILSKEYHMKLEENFLNRNK